MTADDIRELHSETRLRRDAAVKSFWSDDPLNLTYRRETGQNSFSLKSFIAFVVAMPREQFESCAGTHEQSEQIADRLLRDFFKA